MHRSVGHHSHCRKRAGSQRSSAGVRAALVVAVSIACLFGFLHLNDLAAAMMQVAGMAAPIASPSNEVTATPLPASQSQATPAAGPATATGRCVSLPALGAHQLSQTVFVDAGHGGPDPGVVGYAAGSLVREKDLTLSVSERLSTLLRNDGYRVVMSRTGDSLKSHASSSGERHSALFSSHSPSEKMMLGLRCVTASLNWGNMCSAT